MTLGAGDAGRAIADAVCGLNDAVLEFDVRGSGFNEGDVARITDKTLDNAEAEEEREGERADYDLTGRSISFASTGSRTSLKASQPRLMMARRTPTTDCRPRRVTPRSGRRTPPATVDRSWSRASCRPGRACTPRAV